uniref:Uncharacterized protein n=1 Tax=Rhizophora mucronata TaxID=61149 RepID=A0A2P2NWZ4_RHIMU
MLKFCSEGNLIFELLCSLVGSF